MESKIKLYGPPIDNAITKLQKLAKELPGISEGGLSHSMTPSGETLMGDFDFVFHWKEKPDEKQLRSLIKRIDEALNNLGCRYTITTSEDSSYPYRL